MQSFFLLKRIRGQCSPILKTSGLWDRLVNLAQVKDLIAEERSQAVSGKAELEGLFVFQRFFVRNSQFLSTLPSARG
jgi:hypothetical protein